MKKDFVKFIGLIDDYLEDKNLTPHEKASIQMVWIFANNFMQSILDKNKTV